MTRPEGSRQVGITLPQKLIDDVTELAETRYSNFSQTVRAILMEYFDERRAVSSKHTD
jgi:metal-responsive CopG/Arc/MetJ family transcriptional regulator